MKNNYSRLLERCQKILQEQDKLANEKLKAEMLNSERWKTLDTEYRELEKLLKEVEGRMLATKTAEVLL